MHVRVIADEFANIGQIPQFDKLIATIPVSYTHLDVYKRQTQHRINEDVLLSLVSEMLKAIAEYAKHDRAEFVLSLIHI